MLRDLDRCYAALIAMTVYSFWIFDRHSDCVYHKEWKNIDRSSLGDAQSLKRRSSGATASDFPRSKPLPAPRSTQDEAKLIFGIVFSLRNIVRKLTDEDAFEVYTTSKYRLHYFEPPSNLKFVLITDPKVDNLVNVLKQIYVSLYVEYVVKNPLSPIEHTQGEGVNNQLFVMSLEAFMTSLPFFK